MTSDAPSPHLWTLAHGVSLTLDRPHLVGILNVTPDSFFDGGRFDQRDAALAHARQLVDEGATLLDIGGESTRPGAERVSPEAQCERVIPVIEAIRAAGIMVPVSVDTTRSSVASAAIEAGANVVNDVSGGLEDPAILDAAAASGAGLILMHRLAPPDKDAYSTDYQAPPDYSNDGGVVPSVRAFLAERLAAAEACGVARSSVVLDPGLGFGKTVAQNDALMAAMASLGPPGVPLLSAASRKSFLGACADGSVLPPDARLPASLAVTLAHWRMGVRLFRVHDVAAHARALGMAGRIEDVDRQPGVD